MSECPEEGVIDAELVEEYESSLPVLAEPPPLIRPMIDRHTLLAPGQIVPTDADTPRYTEADFRISQETADRLADSKADNTRRAYRYARNAFQEWCGAQGRVSLPCTTATFVEYVNHLISQDLAPSTIRVAMSAIRTLHKDGQEPGIRQATDALDTHAKERARRKRPKKAPAISTDMLRLMVATCSGDDPRDVRDACLLTLGWGMLSRRSELANLVADDLSVDEDGVNVYVAYSKTDQSAKGETTFIPADPNSLTCPVVRTRAWLAVLRSNGASGGPLFRRIARGGHIDKNPRGARGLHMTPDSIGEIVKARAALTGVPDPTRITAHGLRRGPAQEIAEAGGDPTGQGRWERGSATVRKYYLEPAQGKLNNPIAALRRKQAEENTP